MPEVHNGQCCTDITAVAMPNAKTPRSSQPTSLEHTLRTNSASNLGSDASLLLIIPGASCGWRVPPKTMKHPTVTGYSNTSLTGNSMAAPYKVMFNKYGKNESHGGLEHTASWPVTSRMARYMMMIVVNSSRMHWLQCKPSSLSFTDAHLSITACWVHC